MQMLTKFLNKQISVIVASASTADDKTAKRFDGTLELVDGSFIQLKTSRECLFINISYIVVIKEI
ncbi:hypothetical protein [Cetobacterium sp.]|uniref:hypothetical protein n=1 Tax=Cetobacterium sp. TaxID=2071632 RepID=UPI003F33AEFB